MHSHELRGRLGGHSFQDFEERLEKNIVIKPESPAAMWCETKSSSRIIKFAADFFAPEIRAWRGEKPLWIVFWIYGVATSTAIAVLYAVTLYDGRNVLRQILLLCFSAYTAWILVSVWRCAGNTQRQLWGLLARFLTVAWVGNAIMVLTFLQLDLLMGYFSK